MHSPRWYQRWGRCGTRRLSDFATIRPDWATVGRVDCGYRPVIRKRVTSLGETLPGSASPQAALVSLYRERGIHAAVRRLRALPWATPRAARIERDAAVAAEARR